MSWITGVGLLPFGRHEGKSALDLMSEAAASALDDAGLKRADIDGVLTDRLEWMSWKKVTDVSVHRSLADRFNHTATIKVQSANEASGFKAMKGVRDPRDFAQTIADLVNEAHGPIILTPDPRRI